MEISLKVCLFLAVCCGASARLFGRHAYNPGVEEQSKGYEYNTSYYNVQVSKLDLKRNLILSFCNVRVSRHSAISATNWH